MNETRHQQIERLYPRLLGIASRTLDYNATADVVHNTVVTILKLPPDKVTTDSWILRLTVNRALNFIRDNARRAERERGFLDATHGDGEPNPEESLLIEERDDKLYGALLKLNVDDARIISLFFGLHDGDTHTVRAIAKIMGLARSTVHDRIKRSLEFIRSQYHG